MVIDLIFVLSKFFTTLIILWGDEMALCPADMPSRLGGGDNRINEK